MRKLYFNYKKSVEFYEKATKMGNTEALYALGELYYNGCGVEQNYEKAVELYRKAAQLGNTSAQNALGNAYIEGKGVEENNVNNYFF